MHKRACLLCRMDEVQCAVSAMYCKVHQPNGAAMLMSVAAIPMLVTWLQVSALVVGIMHFATTRLE